MVDFRGLSGHGFVCFEEVQFKEVIIHRAFAGKQSSFYQKAFLLSL